MDDVEQLDEKPEAIYQDESGDVLKKQSGLGGKGLRYKNKKTTREDVRGGLFKKRGGGRAAK